MTNYQIQFITNNLEREADYLCYVAKELVEKQYQSNGYSVLPYADPKNLFSVHFPDWPYSKEFWRMVVKFTHSNCGYSFPRSCVTELSGYLWKTEDNKIDKKYFIKDWKKLEKKVISLILEDLASFTVNISVLLTKYGTRGSFYGVKNDDTITIFCTTRIDLPVTELVRTLTMAIYQVMTKAQGEIGSTAYHQWMAFADYSVAFTKISKVIKLKPRLFNQQVNVNLKTYRDSQAFLAKLGLVGESNISFDGEVVKLGKVPLNVFTPQEKQFLAKLIDAKDKVISFEQAGEVIWGNNSDNKFSLYALAKLVENIRTKLRQAGVNTNPIKTIRKQGYLFTG